LGAAQPSLFAEEEMAPARYVPNPRHVRNSLQSLLDELRAARAWPWEPVIVSLKCDIVLPQLYNELSDGEEAARWRALIDAEISRLKAA
jgi:hypothetical protein